MSRALKFLLPLVALCFASGPAPHAQSAHDSRIPSDAVAAQRQREEQFRKVPDRRG